MIPEQKSTCTHENSKTQEPEWGCTIVQWSCVHQLSDLWGTATKPTKTPQDGPVRGRRPKKWDSGVAGHCNVEKLDDLRIMIGLHPGYHSPKSEYVVDQKGCGKKNSIMWLIYIYICIYIYVYIYISVDECLMFFYHSPLKNAARSPRSWHVPGSNHGLKKGYQRTHFLLSFKPHENIPNWIETSF
jgi:hypothetical protein